MIGLLITQRNVNFFLISSIVLALLINCRCSETVVSDRTARAFNRSGVTRAVVLDISKAFHKVWHAGILHKLNYYGNPRQIFGHMSSFPSNGWIPVVVVEILHKKIQSMLKFFKSPFLVLHFFYYKLMTFLMMLSVILLSMLMNYPLF